MKCVVFALFVLVAVAQATPSEIIPYGNPITCFLQHQDEARQIAVDVLALFAEAKDLQQLVKDVFTECNEHHQTPIGDVFCPVAGVANLFRNNEQFKAFVNKVSEKSFAAEALGKKVVACIRED